MIYKVLVRMIERKNYNSVEEMQEKLAILMLSEQITVDEYNELMRMLEA